MKAPHTSSEVDQRRYELLNQMFQHVLSSDFWGEAKADPTLFEDLFCDREAEVAQFKQFCSPMKGASVIFIGRAGVGKSALQHKLCQLIREKKMFTTSREVLSLTFDLEHAELADPKVLILQAVELIRDSYLNVVAPGAYAQLSLGDPSAAVHKLRGALVDLFNLRGANTPYLFFYIDDLDYAPTVWYDLVMSLGPLLSLPFITTIYAVRHELASRMFGNRDSRIQRRVRDAHRIDLPTLPIAEVITNRLIDSTPRQARGWFKSLVSSFFGSHDELTGLMEAVGLRRDGTFKYPFSPKLERFFEKISNGNARDMLVMVKTCLKHIVDTRRLFRPGEDGLYHFTRPLILDLFASVQSPPIVNLNDPNFLSHSSTSPAKKGNPLLLNILEWIHYCEGNQTKQQECFAELGHSAPEVAVGLQECDALGLVEPRVGAPAFDIENATLSSYALTPKGDYHLSHLITWKEYRDRFGAITAKHRIDKKYYSSRLPDQAMFTDLIEFLLYLGTAIRDENQALRHVRVSLTSLIKWYSDYQTTYLSRSAQEKFWPDNPDADHMIDEDKLEFLFEHPPIRDSMGTRKLISRGKYAKHADKMPHPNNVEIDLDAVQFVTDKLGFERQSKIPTRERCNYEYFKELVRTHKLTAA